MSKTNNANAWMSLFTAALAVAAKRCGCDISGLKFETCNTDNTWGDRIGLVFYGASDAVNERAARFFEVWARGNLRRLGVVGGYDAQESIGYEGAFYFARYENMKTGSWYSMRRDRVNLELGAVYSSHGASYPAELRVGVATSFVYYPGAD